MLWSLTSLNASTSDFVTISDESLMLAIRRTMKASQCSGGSLANKVTMSYMEEHQEYIYSSTHAARGIFFFLALDPQRCIKEVVVCDWVVSVGRKVMTVAVPLSAFAMTAMALKGSLLSLLKFFQILVQGNNEVRQKYVSLVYIELFLTGFQSRAGSQ
jgi:hypothetical protein